MESLGQKKKRLPVWDSLFHNNSIIVYCLILIL